VRDQIHLHVSSLLAQLHDTFHHIVELLQDFSAAGREVGHDLNVADEGPHQGAEVEGEQSGFGRKEVETFEDLDRLHHLVDHCDQAAVLALGHRVLCLGGSLNQTVRDRAGPGLGFLELKPLVDHLSRYSGPVHLRER